MEADQRRHGIPREPEDIGGSAAPEEDRLAGPHRHSMEDHFDSLVGQRVGHEIPGPHRDPAGEKEDVGLEPLANLSTELGLVVAHGIEAAHIGPRGVRVGGEHRAVRVSDLSRAGRLGGSDELVSRGQHGDARALHDRDRRLTGRAQQTDVDGPDPVAGFEHGLAQRHVLAAESDVRLLGDGLEHPHLIRRQALGALDDDDGIRPRGNGGSRHDAHGLPLSHLDRRDLAGRDVLDDGEIGRAARNVRGPNRVAVHGGTVERRQVGIGPHGFGEHSPRRLPHGHIVRGPGLGDSGEDLPEGFIDGEHRGGRPRMKQSGWSLDGMLRRPGEAADIFVNIRGKRNGVPAYSRARGAPEVER